MKISLNKRMVFVWVFMIIALFSFSSCSKKENMALPDQMLLPVAGDEIMVVHTSAGDIKIKLLTEVAPKTVDAIKQIIADNVHVGTPLERSYQANLIKTIKDEEPDHYKELFGDDYKVETAPEIRHYTGAVGLSMYEATNPSSSFYIISTAKLKKDYMDSMRSLTELYPEEIVDNYDQYGGLPSIDMSYTIFGQVFEGMDIVDKIYNTNFDQLTLELDATYTIESIELSTYE